MGKGGKLFLRPSHHLDLCPLSQDATPAWSACTNLEIQACAALPTPPFPMQGHHASPFLSQLVSYKKFLNESLSFPPFTNDAQCPATHWRYRGRQHRCSPAFGEPRSLRKTNTNCKREQRQRTRNAQGDRLLSSETNLSVGIGKGSCGGSWRTLQVGVVTGEGWLSTDRTGSKAPGTGKEHANTDQAEALVCSQRERQVSKGLP